MKQLKLEKSVLQYEKSETLTLRLPHLRVVNASPTMHTVNQKSGEALIVFGWNAGRQWHQKLKIATKYQTETSETWKKVIGMHYWNRTYFTFFVFLALANVAVFLRSCSMPVRRWEWHSAMVSLCLWNASRKHARCESHSGDFRHAFKFPKSLQAHCKKFCCRHSVILWVSMCCSTIVWIE